MFLSFKVFLSVFSFKIFIKISMCSTNAHATFTWYSIYTEWCWLICKCIYFSFKFSYLHSRLTKYYIKQILFNCECIQSLTLEKLDCTVLLFIKSYDCVFNQIHFLVWFLKYMYDTDCVYSDQYCSLMTAAGLCHFVSVFVPASIIYYNSVVTC